MNSQLFHDNGVNRSKYTETYLVWNQPALAKWRHHQSPADHAPVHLYLQQKDAALSAQLIELVGVLHWHLRLERQIVRSPSLQSENNYRDTQLDIPLLRAPHKKHSVIVNLILRFIPQWSISQVQTESYVLLLMASQSYYA